MTEEEKKPVLRDERGRLLPGTGALHQSRRNRRRRWWDLLDDAVTDEDIIAIVQQAVDDAKDGNRFARDWLWSYGVGKPGVVTDTTPRDAPMLRLMQTWLVAQVASGQIKISELSGELKLPLLVEPDEDAEGED